MSRPLEDRARARGFPWALTLVTILCLAILLALGTWQVQRLAWKEALVATIDSRVSAAPVPLAEVEKAAGAGGDIEYQPVAVAGTFLHDKEQFFFATHDGQSGWYVYTPLSLADGRFVFVNRGFVPYDRKDPASRPEGQVEGEVELTGLSRVAEAEKPSFIVPDNDAAKNVFYWKDLREMAESAGLDGETVLPFFIDAGDAANPGGLPIGGVTRIDLPNSHLQYAVTWYGLALTLVLVVIAWGWRNRAGRRP